MSAHPPTMTPQEALAIVKIVPVPVELFLQWVAAAGAVPSQFGAELYVSMRQTLEGAIQYAAEQHMSATCRRCNTLGISRFYATVKRA